MSTLTPIEIVREYQRWRRAQGQYAGLCQCPHTPEEIGLALDSVLADAERLAALERAHESGETHQGWSTRIKEKYKMHSMRVLCAGTLAEIADRLREGAI